MHLILCCMQIGEDNGIWEIAFGEFTKWKWRAIIRVDEEAGYKFSVFPDSSLAVVRLPGGIYILCCR